MNDYKKEIFQILLAFDEFCKQNGIRYYLAYGTLLGAVRHGGFIPWDDDIDVVVFKEDYLKLKLLAKSNKFIDSHNRYSICIPGDKDYCYSFIKIVDNNYLIEEKNLSSKYRIGLFIDVFRLDYWPDNHILEFCQLKTARFLMRLKEILIRGNLVEFIYIVLDKLLKPFDVILKRLNITTEKVVVLMESIGLNNKHNSEIGNIMSCSGWKSERIPLSIYDEIFYLDFEGHPFPVPKDYKRYLECIYGDYMTIPDKKNQVGHEYNVITKK